MTVQLHTDTQADRRKRKFSFFAYALLKDKKEKENPALNFLSGFLFLPSFSTFAAYIFLCVEKFSHKKILATPPVAKELNPSRKTKTPAKKFCLPALASWTVIYLLTFFISVDNWETFSAPTQNVINIFCKFEPL